MAKYNWKKHVRAKKGTVEFEYEKELQDILSEFLNQPNTFHVRTMIENKIAEYLYQKQLYTTLNNSLEGIKCSIKLT